jgi:hypothetical protein
VVVVEAACRAGPQPAARTAAIEMSAARRMSYRKT